MKESSSCITFTRREDGSVVLNVSSTEEFDFDNLDLTQLMAVKTHNLFIYLNNCDTINEVKISKLAEILEMNQLLVMEE
jgi:hypothetical protein